MKKFQEYILREEAKGYSVDINHGFMDAVFTGIVKPHRIDESWPHVFIKGTIWQDVEQKHFDYYEKILGTKLPIKIEATAFAGLGAGKGFTNFNIHLIEVDGKKIENQNLRDKIVSVLDAIFMMWSNAYHKEFVELLSMVSGKDKSHLKPLDKDDQWIVKYKDWGNPQERPPMPS